MLPLVLFSGSFHFGGMGVQAESIWIQIRTIAISILNGHDVVQNKYSVTIIILLMDGAATQVSDGTARLRWSVWHCG